MAVYTLRKRVNPQKLEEPMKYFPSPYYTGSIDLEKISENISSATTLTQADVTAVIQALIMQIPHYMELGLITKLDGLGSFRLSFSGEGKENPSDITAKDIDDIHIIFTPDIKLRRKVKKFKFSKMKI